MNDNAPDSQPQTVVGSPKTQAWIIKALVLIVIFALIWSFVRPSKTRSWQEQVMLSSGETIVVKRSWLLVRGGGEIARSSGWRPESGEISFQYPQGSGQWVTWRTNPRKVSWPEYPLVFDVETVTKTPYVIARGWYTKNPDSRTDGCWGYIKYSYADGKWQEGFPIPNNSTPRPPNLLLGSRDDYFHITTLAEKEEHNSDHRITRAHKSVNPSKFPCHLAEPK